jgi:hypothetical protein
MINKLKFIVYTLIIIILPSIPLKGSIVVDFEKISEKKFRVIALNTKTQQLLLYKEIGKNQNEELTEFNKYGYTLNIIFNPNINIEVILDLNIFPREPMILCSKNIIHCDGWDHGCLGDYNIYPSDIIIVKTPQEICGILPEPRKKEPSGTFFPIVRYEDKSVKTLENLSIEDKGKLGELATTLTMLSFGYIQHPSKYGGDNGFDSVFETGPFVSEESTKYLFLSQSKQEKKQRTAENIMKVFLNERKIWETIQEMERIGGPDVQATANIIKAYFQEKPKNVYKLAYRMMNKGLAQCYVNELNIQGFIAMKGLRLVKAPLEEKIKSVQDVLSIFEDNFDQQLTLVLTSMSQNIHKDQALKILEQVYDLPIQELEVEYLPKSAFKMEIHPPSLLPKLEVSITENASPQLKFATNSKKKYNHSNLFGFLKYLQSKGHSKYTISDKLKGVEGASSSTIQRLLNDKNYVSKKSENLWGELLKKYPEEFTQWSEDQKVEVRKDYSIFAFSPEKKESFTFLPQMQIEQSDKLTNKEDIQQFLFYLRACNLSNEEIIQKLRNDPSYSSYKDVITHVRKGDSVSLNQSQVTDIAALLVRQFRSELDKWNPSGSSKKLNQK